MHITSCLIHFALACFPCTIIFISCDKSFHFETMQQHIVSHSHNFYLSYEFYNKSNKPLIDIWAFMSIMNTCSHFFLFCLSYTSETSLRILEPLYQPWIPCSISFYNFCLPLWVPHKLTSFNTILEPSYYTWIPCSSIFLSHSSLSHIMIVNGTYTFACNTWAISFHKLNTCS